MPQLDQRVEVETGQPELHRPRVVEARVGGEVGGQPLGERRQPLHALLAVEEGRGAGDDQEQAGEAAGVDLVDELPQRVERLVAGVGAHPLQGLDLVEDQEQPGVPAVAQDGEQPLQEAQRAEVVEVAAHPGVRRADGGDRLWLAAEPGEDSFGGGRVPVERGAAVAAQGGGEGRRGPGDAASRSLQQLVDRATPTPHCLRPVRVAPSRHLLFQRVEPGVDDRPQRARRARSLWSAAR